jgi:hypothetical protein
MLYYAALIIKLIRKKRTMKSLIFTITDRYNNKSAN